MERSGDRPTHPSQEGVDDLRTELMLAHRELTWCRSEQEHLAENLARCRRQRTRLREQVAAMSDLLASSLSAAYWAGQAHRLPFGRRSSPEAAMVREVEACPLFDGGWYLRKHGAVAQEGLSPAVHYVRRSVARPLDPGPRFSTNAYLAAHPDARDSGLPPLVHAIRNGLFSDAEPLADAPAPSAADVHL